MFNEGEVGTGQYFWEGVDDTPHREGELEILHQMGSDPSKTLHFFHQKAKIPLQIHSNASM